MPAPVPMVVPAVSSRAQVMRRTGTAGTIESPSHGRVKARMKATARAKRRVKTQAKAQARVWRRGVHCQTGKRSSIRCALCRHRILWSEVLTLRCQSGCISNRSEIISRWFPKYETGTPASRQVGRRGCRLVRTWASGSGAVRILLFTMHCALHTMLCALQIVCCSFSSAVVR